MDYKDESGEVALLGSGEKANERTEGGRGVVGDTTTANNPLANIAIH